MHGSWFVTSACVFVRYGTVALKGAHPGAQWARVAATNEVGRAIIGLPAVPLRATRTHPTRPGCWRLSFLSFLSFLSSSSSSSSSLLVVLLSWMVGLILNTFKSTTPGCCLPLQMCMSECQIENRGVAHSATASLADNGVTVNVLS
jgi:hypothetical protein